MIEAMEIKAMLDRMATPDRPSRQELEMPILIFGNPKPGLCSVRERVKHIVKSIEDGLGGRYPVFVHFVKGDERANRLIIDSDNPGQVVLLKNIAQVLDEADRKGELRKNPERMLGIIGGLR